MRFCSYCGQSVNLRIPDGDNRERHVCEGCGVIHYQNPKIVAGCIPRWQDKVLLCRRAIEPRKGLWTLPAGFMENGETTEQAAQRETHEEACAEVQALSLYTLFNLPNINQVYMFFRAELVAPEYASGIESLDVDLFAEHEIPWNELAFPVVHESLKLYFSDLKAGIFHTYTGDIIRDKGNWLKFSVENVRTSTRTK